MDINLDGIDDFSIDIASPGLIYINSLYSGAMVQVNSFSKAVAFSSGATIGANTWLNGTSIPLNNFYGQGAKYLGLKITVAGNTYYGWASIDIPNSQNYFTIHQFAYEDTPSTPIFANQTTSSVGIFENAYFQSNLSIYPNPVKNDGILFLDVKFQQNIKLEFIDAYGKIIIEDTVNNKIIYLSNFNLAKGIYVLKFYENQFCIDVKKIILE